MPATPSLAPGIRNSPFALRAFFLDPVGCLRRQYERHGDVSSLVFGSVKATLLNHPDLMKEVLVTNARSFKQPSISGRNKGRYGDSLFVLEGEGHRVHRRMLNPAFSPARVRDYAQLVLHEARLQRDAWQAGQVVDMRHETTRFTLMVICNALFSVDMDASALQVIHDLHQSHADYTDLHPLLALGAAILPMGPAHRQYRAESELDLTLKRLIAARRSSHEERSDILSTLLDARSPDGEAISDQVVRDDLVSLFWAGHETTANSMAWAWHLLATNPTVDEQVLAELTRALQGREATVDDLPNLPYLRQVVTEIFRVYPPIWAYLREPVADYTLIHEGRQYLLPARSMVVLSPWLLHRDTRFWNEPQQFDPGRWTPERAPQQPANSYAPFGIGHRKCMGEGLAWMEIMLSLAVLLPRWKAVPATEAPVTMQAGITLQPVGLKLRLEPRQSVS